MRPNKPNISTSKPTYSSPSTSGNQEQHGSLSALTTKGKKAGTSIEEPDKDSVEEEELKAGHIPLQKELHVRKCVMHTKALTQSYISRAHPGAYRHARCTTRHGNLRKAESLQTGP